MKEGKLKIHAFVERKKHKKTPLSKVNYVTLFTKKTNKDKRCFYVLLNIWHIKIKSDVSIVVSYNPTSWLKYI